MATVGTQHLRRISALRAVFLALLSVLHPAACEDQVPLILWTSEGASVPALSPPAAGHIVEQQQLASYLDAAVSAGPRNVVLFLQDKMSLEDFTVYGGAFGNKQDSVFPNLEAALRSSPLVLPAVSWPASNAVIGQLQDRLETSPLYLDPETLSQLRLNASSPALLVFRLPYGLGADLMSAKEILSGNDEVIGQVLATMTAQSVPYTALYTGLRPSRESAALSVEAGLGGGRSLLQYRGGYRERERQREKQQQRRMKQKAEVFPPVEFKEGEGETCILLWAKSLSVGIFRRGRWEDHDLTPDTFGKDVRPKLHGSTCDKTKSRLVLNYNNVLGHNVFKLTLAMSQRHYKVSARRWFTLDSVELDYDGTKASFNGSRHIYAPAEYSYRCESVSSARWPLLVPRTTKDPANQWRVSFEDFQVQGFNVSDSEFSYASDCAGFFSPGIWMGLMTSLLMVLLLTYGLHMILQLHTMDRFDDPKGPAISVPQTE